jgi:hypothetical protein
VRPSKRKRHKLDLSPIPVDEALSNPALSGIERTLRDLVAVRNYQTLPSADVAPGTVPASQHTTKAPSLSESIPPYIYR